MKKENKKQLKLFEGVQFTNPDKRKRGFIPYFVYGELRFKEATEERTQNGQVKKH